MWRRVLSYGTLPAVLLCFGARAQEMTAQPAGAASLDPFLRGLGMAVVFTAIGLCLFGAAFLVMAKVCPFSIRKEIEEDHNTALAIVLGSVILGIAIIVAASIHG